MSLVADTARVHSDAPPRKISAAALLLAELRKLPPNAPDGGVIAYQTALAAQLGVHRSTVIRALRDLCATGLIAVQESPEPHGPNTYRLT